MTKEELLQDWLQRLMSALKDVRHKESASAEETLYELYVEMNQQTLAEKISTFSEITLEDQMSAMAIELLAAQKRVAYLELVICQRAFEAKQELGEPVAWRYKPVREDNPRWEYTTQHPLDMGDGYLRPSLVEYCKCIEPLYATEKPKLILEKFREMKDLLEDTVQQEPATKEQIREAIVFNLPLYTTPPSMKCEGPQQRKPLTDGQIKSALADMSALQMPFNKLIPAIARAIEAAHGIKE